MKALSINKYLVRTGAVYLTAAIFFMGVPLNEIFAAPSVDIKANGQDGTVIVNNGDSWSYTWNIAGATVCQLVSPSGTTGLVEFSGSDGPIPPGHPWYPAVGGSTTLTLNCTDGDLNASDSVTITVVEPGTPGPSPEVTVDIKAEGSDGPVTIVNGTSWNYSWTTSGATVCQLVSPSGTTGLVEFSGSDGPIPPGHPWYPTIGSPTTLTINCTNGDVNATDSVVINVVGGGGPAPTISADIKINGSDTLVTIFNGESWNYSWTTSGATVCQLVSPSGTTGLVEFSGSDGPIPPGHPWYPAVGSITTLTINCTNGDLNVTDSASIRVIERPIFACPVPQITSPLTASVTVNNSFSYTITATTTGVTSTTTTFSVSNLPAGLSFNASTATISGTPTNTGTFNITITATNACGSDAETLVLTVNPAGGGGGGGGSSSGSVQPGAVLGAATISDFCPYLTSYMRLGANNDTLQVIRLQAFLKAYEKFDYVTVNGVFDAATHQAVKEFQLRYKSEVLTPWGINVPTGYVYKLTLAKINNILCGSPMPAVLGAAKVVKAKPQVLGKEAAGYKEGARKEGMGTSTVSSLPLIGNDISKGQNPTSTSSGYPEGLAAALFTWPSDGAEVMKCLYQLLLILVVLYILGSVLESVLYKDTPENVLKRFRAKWVTFTAGLAVAWALAYYLQEWCLLFPLLVAFVISLIWLLTRPRHSSMKATAQSWYLAGSNKVKPGVKDKAVDNSNNTTVLIPEKK